MQGGIRNQELHCIIVQILYINTHIYTYTQIHKYTNTQINKYKFTNMHGREPLDLEAGVQLYNCTLLGRRVKSEESVLSTISMLTAPHLCRSLAPKYK